MLLVAMKIGNGGYNVVPKEVDPHNAYTIAQIEAYLAEHPEHLLDAEAIEAERQRQQECHPSKLILQTPITSTQNVWNLPLM